MNEFQQQIQQRVWCQYEQINERPHKNDNRGEDVENNAAGQRFPQNVVQPVHEGYKDVDEARRSNRNVRPYLS